MSPAPETARLPVTPDDVTQAVAVFGTTLAPEFDADWSIPAGTLTWTCRETLDHLSDALSFYCGQLATRTSVWRPLFRNGDPAASIANLFTALETGGAMLGAIACTTPSDVRAYHRMGQSDPEGFLAMACEEILVHTWDIAQGFGRTVDVPNDLAAKVINRLFPWAPTNCTAWEAQLWCSDRIALPDRAKIGQWGWHAAPLGDDPRPTQPPIVFPADF